MMKNNDLISREVKKISDNKVTLVNLLNDFENLNSFKHHMNRHRNNKYRYTINNLFYILFGFILLYVVATVISFFRKVYITIFVVLIIIFLVLSLLWIWYQKDNFRNYSIEMIRERDKDLFKLLERYKINSNNIQTVINYYELILEPKKIFVIKTPIADGLIKFGSYFSTLLVGIITPSIIKEYLSYNTMKTYAFIFTTIILVLFCVVILKLYLYLTKRDNFLSKLQIFVNELKKIKILEEL